MFYGKEISTSSQITVIIDTFYRPKELKFAIESIYNQTYKNFEIIIIDNKSNQETKQYLYSISNKEEIRIIKYNVNQFSFEDPQRMIRICCNDALKIARGDLIFYLSDDDWIEKNFFSEILKAFVNNSKCTTAIGRIVSYYNDKKKIYHKIKERPFYLKGKIICLDEAQRINKYNQSNPGHSFVIKKDVLKFYGGFQVPLELHQLYGIVAFGESAFCQNAIMYWRRHQKQLNKFLNQECFYDGDYYQELINSNNNNIFSNWKKIYSKSESDIINNYFQYLVLKSFFHTFFCMIFKFKFVKAVNFYINRKAKIKEYNFTFNILIISIKEAFLRSNLFKKFRSMMFYIKMIVFFNKNR